MQINVFIACCFWMTLVDLCYGGQGPIVSTKYGTVEGLSSRQNGRSYDVFYGIPFGSSVSGDNRWDYATFQPSWNGVYNATAFGPYCKQLITPFHKFIGINTIDTEDCLYLNIYVPGAVTNTKDLPVMVFIYGGAFLVGVSDMYPGEDLAVTGKVIVVSINYRLGTMGFLSSGDRYAEGNFGLYDQLQALRWIKENIGSFGGDSSRITIFGQSAGSASVSHLALSPLTKGLFQRVIQISGSAAAYFGTTQAQPATTKMTALATACPSLNSKRMIKCLKKRKPYVLDIAGIVAPLVLGKGRVPNWIPRVDGYLVSDDPRYLITKGANKHLDMIAGHTKHDAAFIVYANPFGLGYNKWFSITKNIKLYKACMKLFLSPYQNADELENMIVQQYPSLYDEDLDNRTRTGVYAMTDFIFSSPALFDVKHHAKRSSTSRTYLYEYAYRNSFFKYEDWVQGSHIDDMYSVLGEPFMRDFRHLFLRRRYKKEDKLVKETIQKYYANFAYSGNPNQGPHEIEEFWPQYDDNSKSYMEFNLKSNVQKVDEERYKNHIFWSETFWRAAKPTTEDDAGNIKDYIEAAKEFVAKVVEWWKEIEGTENQEDLIKILEKMMEVISKYLEKFE